MTLGRSPVELFSYQLLWKVLNLSKFEIDTHRQHGDIISIFLSFLTKKLNWTEMKMEAKNFTYSISYIKVHLSFMYKPTNSHLWSCYVCLLFLASACFGHFCDHLQDIPQYKHQPSLSTVHFQVIEGAVHAQNNTAVFYHILIKDFMRFFAAFIMDRILENFIVHLMWFL
jgi:hypothetical protein